MMNEANKKRFGSLPMGVMIDLLARYEDSANDISSTHTFTFDGQVIGDRSAITDEMLLNLLHVSNMLWHAVRDAEINKMMSEAGKS